MTQPQHTLKIRIGKQIVDIACPPFANVEILDRWLEQYKESNPSSVIVSKSWKTGDAS